MNTRQLTLFGLVAALLALLPVQAEVRWLDKIAAIAGQDVITQVELEQESQLIASELRARKARTPSPEQFRRQVLERLILQKLQLQKAHARGIHIDDITLNRAVDSIASENNMSVTRFRQAMQEEGLSYVAFRNNLRSELTLDKLHQRVVGNRINITDQEVQDLIEKSIGGKGGNQRYQLKHILIALPEAAAPSQVEKARKKAEDLRQQGRDGADFSQLAIAHSNGQRALEGGDLGWRNANELPSRFTDQIVGMQAGDISKVIRSPSGFHLIKVADIDTASGKPKIKQTLARHILISTVQGHSNTEAKALITQLYQQIQEGKDFAKLARKNSEDPGSAEKGGELGWASPGTFVPAFEQTLDQLKPGEVSPPFKSRFGWHIIQLKETRVVEAPDKLLQSRAKELLAAQKKEEELQLWLRKLRSEAFVEYRLPGMEDPSS